MLKKIRKIDINVSKNMPSAKMFRGRPKKKEEFHLDEIDKKILRVLINNPRSSLRYTASEAALSVGTVRDHISKMQKNKVIKGYTTIIDPVKLGYTITAIIKIFEKKEDMKFIKEKIGVLPNVFALYFVAGNADAILMAKFKNSGELNDLIKKILQMKNVLRTETFLVLDTYKEDFRNLV